MRSGLRTRVVAGVAASVWLLGWLGVRLAHRYGVAWPEPTWLAGLLLVGMAVAILLAGRLVRRAVRGIRPIEPLRAARILVLAQACALTGAVVTGWNLALATVLLPDLDAGSVAARAVLCVALAACGVFLSAAGLLAQSACRLPPEDDPERDERG